MINMMKCIRGAAAALFVLSASLPAFADKFEYDHHGKRDPFVSITEAGWGFGQMGYGDLRLEGILMDASGHYAMINGEMVQEGGIFGGFKITRIDANRVQVEKEGDKLDLFLRMEEELDRRTRETESKMAQEITEDAAPFAEEELDTSEFGAEGTEELKKLAELTKKRLTGGEAQELLPEDIR